MDLYINSKIISWFNLLVLSPTLLIVNGCIKPIKGVSNITSCKISLTRKNVVLKQLLRYKY